MQLARPPTFAIALPDKPSIAVLPFANMSDERAQDYFADGITDDIITELSRFSELFVIARNSSFQYKGQAVDIRRVGHDLGVRYVLEGTVRRGGDRVRIGAQLVDAVTGIQRWAERYDRKLEDVFAIQDEVVARSHLSWQHMSTRPRSSVLSSSRRRLGALTISTCAAPRLCTPTCHPTTQRTSASRADISS